MEKLEQIKIIEQICPLYKNGTSKRELRHDFFKEINTEIQAYLLGFHAADGRINDERLKNCNKIQIKKLLFYRLIFFSKFFLMILL